MNDPNVGLCADCRYGRVKRSAKGSDFWRCSRADRDPAFLRYPPLPVRTCPGFAETGAPETPEGETSR